MKKLIYLFLGIAAFVFCSCQKDDNLSVQDISVEFAVAESGMEGNQSDIHLKLSRSASATVEVTVEMESSDVSTADIEISPSITDNQIVVSIPQGQSTASFTVAKAEGKNPEGKAKFKITAISQTKGYKIGATNEMTLSFSAIVSTGGKMTLEGNEGDEKYANMVYVDLSNNSQVKIHRKSWELGFYCGEDFKVILNSSYATVAASTEKTDFASVTFEDAQNAPNLSAGAMSEDFSAEWIDHLSGDLNQTAFQTIAEAEDQNKVYFVATEQNKADRSQWYKVKVTREGHTYRIQYGKVGDSTPQMATISKVPTYNFIGFSLESGKITDAQPEGKRWDIMWAYAAASSVMTSGEVISFSQDVVTSNRAAGVSTAQVMVDEQTTYSRFTGSDLSKVLFEEASHVIGTNWRTPAMPGITNAGVKTDRFYIIRDAYGNYYKLRFTKFGTTTDGTERGRPEIEYELLK